jgi:hypothetical protein
VPVHDTSVRGSLRRERRAIRAAWRTGCRSAPLAGHVAQARPITLLERERALVTLAAALAEAALGEGRVALVYGEPGIGKPNC